MSSTHDINSKFSRLGLTKRNPDLRTRRSINAIAWRNVSREFARQSGRKSTFYQDALLTIYAHAKQRLLLDRKENTITIDRSWRGVERFSIEERWCRSDEERRRMSVSRTAFTRIHRDALPTVKRRTNERANERKRECARSTHCFAPRYGPRPVPAMAFHLTHREVTRSGVERARLVARSLQRVQREGTHTREREERERGPQPAWPLAPFSLPSFSPSAFPLSAFSPCICLHSLPSQLYMRGETHYMSSKKS